MITGAVVNDQYFGDINGASPTLAETRMEKADLLKVSPPSLHLIWPLFCVGGAVECGTVVLGGHHLVIVQYGCYYVCAPSVARHLALRCVHLAFPSPDYLSL